MTKSCHLGLVSFHLLYVRNINQKYQLITFSFTLLSLTSPTSQLSMASTSKLGKKENDHDTITGVPADVLEKIVAKVASFSVQNPLMQSNDIDFSIIMNDYFFI